MSQWLNQRNEFYRVMVTQGITQLEEVTQAFPLGYNIPQEKIEKWFSRLLKTPKEFSNQRRYVNRFKIGADPEFIFQGEVQVPNEIDSRRPPMSKLLRVDAQALKLRQGPAFGADNNGRLAEIRPHPSRSALEVVASILSTFRWMAILYPNTLKLQWVSGAYLHDDGIGGHVHFGRKRPNRKAEIVALDTVSDLLLALNVFPNAEVRRRRQGDPHGNHPYGLNGDFRLQTHGYEYRTWPSWLDSPELAFVTLTLSKLAVHDPKLLEYRLAKDLNQRFQQVRNLLAYYKDVDDDARLALLVVQRRFPRHQGGDFKARWGLHKISTIPDTKHIRIVPPSIPSDQLQDEEVFRSLYLDEPLGYRYSEPTWNPIAPPSGFEMCIDYVNTIHQKGLGEMIWDFAYSKDYPIVFVGSGNGGPSVTLGKSLWNELPESERNLKWIALYSDAKPNTIYINQSCRENPRSFAKVREWLTRGYLPLWQVNKIQPSSFQQWKDHAKPAVKEPKYQGKILFTDNPKFKEA